MDSKDCPPTYEESLPSFSSAPSTLTSRLSAARTSRIETLIDAHILPLLTEQAAAGLHRAATIVIPSSVSALQDTPSSSGSKRSSPDDPEELTSTDATLAGFPLSDAAVRTVRLHGAANSLEFWRQPEALADLRSTLEARLAAQGHRVARAETIVAAPVTPAEDAAARRKKSGGFFGRRKSDRGAQGVMATSGSAVGAVDLSVPPGHVRVRVNVEDVTMRMLTNMGLYDSRTGPAVVVDVEIG